MSVPIARKLRKTQTDAELRLWHQLRGRRLGGLKFKRQVPIAGFVADFVCEEARLVIEIDGSQHGTRAAQDEERTKRLNIAGYEVLRFWNNDVTDNLDGVLVRVLETARVTRNEV
jgi:very-short-patch-repair endonuclease